MIRYDYYAFKIEYETNDNADTYVPILVSITNIDCWLLSKAQSLNWNLCFN